MYTTTNTTTNATFISSTTTITIASITTSITTTCKVKSIKMKISRSIRINRLSNEHIDKVKAMTNCIRLSSNTTALTTITTIRRGMKVKF